MSTEEERKIKRRKYQQSDKGKASIKKYAQSEKGKRAARRFAQSDKGRESRKRIKRTPLCKYTYQKARAKLRGIEWLFTFETWWAIWEPHFDKRGQGSSDLQMCRTGDTGPYSPDNVRIDTSCHNLQEAWEIRRRKKNEQ